MAGEKETIAGRLPLVQLLSALARTALPGVKGHPAVAPPRSPDTCRCCRDLRGVGPAHHLSLIMATQFSFITLDHVCGLAGISTGGCLYVCLVWKKLADDWLHHSLCMSG